MTIIINFIPNLIVHFVKENFDHRGKYCSVVFDNAWGDKGILSNCKDYFSEKIEAQDLRTGLLFVEKSTLKYKILDVEIRI